MTIIVLWIFLGIITFIVILLHFSVRAEIEAEGSGVDIKVKYLFFTIYPRKAKQKKLKRNSNKKSNEKPDDSSASFKEFKDDLDEELEKIDDFADEFLISDENLEETYSDSDNADDDILLDDNLENIFEDEIETTDNSCQAKPLLASENSKKTKKKLFQKNKDKPETKRRKKEKSESKFSELKSKYGKIKPYIPMGWKYFKKLLKSIRITDVNAEITAGKEDACEAALNYGKIQGALFNALGFISNIFTVKIKRADVKCVFNKKVFKYRASAVIRIRPSAIIAIAFCLLVSFLSKFLPSYIKQKRLKSKKRKVSDKKTKKKLAANNI